MAETIDFQREAHRLVARLTSGALSQADVEDALRLVWNARGAADIAEIELALAAAMGSHDAAGPFLKHLDVALRGLDRA